MKHLWIFNSPIATILTIASSNVGFYRTSRNLTCLKKIGDLYDKEFVKEVD
jgi:hypothetical protein